MRTLWRDDVASFDGKFVGFDAIRVNPKPVRDRRIPVVVGGNSDAALRRVAAWGDGWYGFNLDGVAAVRERVAKLERLCAESGRDRASCGCPWRCAIRASATSARSPSWASTSWSSWRRPLTA